MPSTNKDKIFIYMGTPSPCPWDLTLSGKHHARAALPPRTCLRLGRRSGRIPALPYPPPR